MAAIDDSIGIPSVAPEPARRMRSSASTPARKALAPISGRACSGQAKASRRPANSASDISNFWGEVQGDGAISNAMQDVNATLAKYRSLRGADALNAQQDTQKQIDEIFRHHRDTLSSPAQQAQYDSATRNYRNRYVDGIITTHAIGEAREHAAKTNQEFLHGCAQSARRERRGRSDQVEMFRHDARQALVRQTQIEGDSDPEAIKAAVTRADQAVHKTVAETIGVKDPARALKYVEDHREELGDVYHGVANEMRNRAKAETGNQIAADAIASRRAGSLAPPPRTARFKTSRRRPGCRRQTSPAQCRSNPAAIRGRRPAPTRG